MLVLLISGMTGKDVFDSTVVERLLETAIGAALALAFGVVAPLALRRRS